MRDLVNESIGSIIEEKVRQEVSPKASLAMMMVLSHRKAFKSDSRQSKAEEYVP